MSATSSQFIPIVPPSNLVVSAITTILGAQGMAVSSITLTVASSGIVPAWCIPGAGAAINVTISGIPILIGGVIKAVAANGTTLTISPHSEDARSITTAYSNQALDATGGSVVNTITLNAICQKAMFSVASGNNVMIAPVADANGANPLYSVTLVAGGAEYEVTAPTGAKFDLADWYCQGVGGTGTLQVRFL